MIAGMYKMHINNTNIKIRVYNYCCNNLVKAANLETKTL